MRPDHSARPCARPKPANHFQALDGAGEPLSPQAAAAASIQARPLINSK